MVKWSWFICKFCFRKAGCGKYGCLGSRLCKCGCHEAYFANDGVRCEEIELADDGVAGCEELELADNEDEENILFMCQSFLVAHFLKRWLSV